MTRPVLSALDLVPIPEGSSAAAALAESVRLAVHLERLGYARHWLAEHHFVAVGSSSPAVVAAHVLQATSTLGVGVAAIQLGQRRPAAVAEEWATLEAFHPGRVSLALGRSAGRGDEYRKALAKARENSGSNSGANSGSAPGAAPSSAGATASPSPPPAPGHRVVDGVVIPERVDPRSHVTSTATLRGIDLLSTPGASALPFDEQVAELVALLRGRDRALGVTGAESLPPLSPPGAGVRTVIAGSSGGESAQVAGQLGLPFVANYHVLPSSVLDAVSAYREAFRAAEPGDTGPGDPRDPDVLSAPAVSVSADVLVADTRDEAEFLARSFLPWVAAIRSGAGAIPVPRPDDVPEPSPELLARHDDRLRTRFVGTAAEVVPRLEALAELTGAEELLITTLTHDPGARRRSYELLAEAWGAAGLADSALVDARGEARAAAYARG